MPSKSFGPTTTTADTKTTIGAAYTVPKSGTVRRIRVAGYNAVTAKSGSAMLKVESDRQTGMLAEYAVNLGSGASVGDSSSEEIISPALSLEQGEIITVSVTSAEAVTDIIVSIEWA